MKKSYIFWLLHFMSIKVFEDDEDDNDKFYRKLLLTVPSNYLEIWVFFPKKVRK